MTPIAKPALLEDLAVHLFGAHWQIPLAAALKVNPRTVRRWIFGEGGKTWPIPDRAWSELFELCEARKQAGSRFQAAMLAILAPEKCAATAQKRAPKP